MMSTSEHVKPAPPPEMEILPVVVPLAQGELQQQQQQQLLDEDDDPVEVMLAEELDEQQTRIEDQDQGFKELLSKYQPALAAQKCIYTVDCPPSDRYIHANFANDFIDVFNDE